MAARIPDPVIGAVYGRLTVTGPSALIPSDHNRSTPVQCSCGTILRVLKGSLIHNTTKSCGCLREEVLAKNKTTHNMSHTPEFKAWCHMRQRCDNPNDAAYKHYGARGIVYCDEWKTFENFIADVGLKPSKTYTLERLDTNGNYERSNVVWADIVTQRNNTRNSVRVPYKGELLTIKELAKIATVAEHVLSNRLRVYGWPVEKALHTPVGSVRSTSPLSSTTSIVQKLYADQPS